MKQLLKVIRKAKETNKKLKGMKNFSYHFCTELLKLAEVGCASNTFDLVTIRTDGYSFYFNIVNSQAVLCKVGIND